MNMDFSAFMVLLVVVSGGIWAFDSLVLAPKRRGGTGGNGVEGSQVESPPQPKLVEFARSLFPIFLIVLILRSFLVEPFRIPSGSMMPTLLVGDFILVNKFIYGVRLPVLNTEVIDISEPERGDVVVFRYPEDPSIPFIKRVVGLPGDRIGYYDKVLHINGKPIPQRSVGTYSDTGAGSDMTGADIRVEVLSGTEHTILIQRQAPSRSGEMTVPEGHYFVLGDNRDNSRDSRYWGTVPDENLIGKAFVIWMNWDWSSGGIAWGRLGDSID